MTISTTRGNLDESVLTKLDCCSRGKCVDDENETTHFTEYWLGGDPECQHKILVSWPSGEIKSLDCQAGCGAEQVHRSVQMHLKKPMVWSEGGAASF